MYTTTTYIFEKDGVNLHKTQKMIYFNNEGELKWLK